MTRLYAIFVVLNGEGSTAKITTPATPVLIKTAATEKQNKIIKVGVRNNPYTDFAMG